MKFIGINASPRKKANTQTLVEAVLEGAAEKGAETRLVNLREININGCLGCEGCKKHLGKCAQKDDLTTIMQEMTDYDVVVMGTPVYWFHVAGQFKLLVDRLYSFLEFKANPETGQTEINSAFPKNRKLLFIISRGDPEPPEFYPELYNHMNDWFKLIPLSLGTESYELFHQYGANLDRKSAANDSELLTKARAKGAELV
ncbi:MAG: flavodoxin family protein [Deltaproteobacteria bacterium]|nr:flavodoxin family protein [Deltaproteobacteria bacterium]MBW2365576.1 flavodoxin family protein [Deltaproteobacteria bacterium]